MFILVNNINTIGFSKLQILSLEDCALRGEVHQGVPAPFEGEGVMNLLPSIKFDWIIQNIMRSPFDYDLSADVVT